MKVTTNACEERDVQWIITHENDNNSPKWTLAKVLVYVASIIAFQELKQ